MGMTQLKDYILNDDRIRTTAEGMVKAHGPRAKDECETMILKWSNRADATSAETWQRVLVIVREIELEKYKAA